MLNNTEMREEKENLYRYTRIIGGEIVNFVTTNVDLAFSRTHDKVDKYEQADS